MSLDTYLTFVAVVAVLAITPGPDMALLMRQVIAHGRKAALFTLAGIICGQVVYGVLSVLGLAALIAESQPAFLTLRIAGALYLVYVGGRSLWAARPRSDAAARDAGALSAVEVAAPIQAATAERGSWRAAWGLGATTTLLNPKVGLLFVSFIPQFIGGGADPAAQAALLAATFTALGSAFLVAYILAVHAMATRLRSPRARRLTERLTGATLVCVGGRVLASTR